mmetsp:Transcript_10494/g.23105  ORF Transcript_10494/g.23105 Transcript_10494/m.23105 type:complete len:204 (+) Transcript_10494:274-885(+)
MALEVTNRMYGKLFLKRSKNPSGRLPSQTDSSSCSQAQLVGGPTVGTVMGRGPLYNGIGIRVADGVVIIMGEGAGANPTGSKGEVVVASGTWLTCWAACWAAVCWATAGATGTGVGGCGGTGGTATSWGTAVVGTGDEVAVAPNSKKDHPSCWGSLRTSQWFCGDRLTCTTCLTCAVDSTSPRSNARTASMTLAGYLMPCKLP